VCSSDLLLFVIISLLALLATQSVTVQAQPKTITVPDDYPTIEAALGNASSGDTIFVKKGTYEGNLYVGPSLSLIGEDSRETIIKGWFYRFGDYQTISASENVRISGFTIMGNLYGIRARTGCEITGNNIVNRDFSRAIGVQLDGDDILVSKNNITGQFSGIEIFRSSNSIISSNRLYENYFGVSCEESSFNTSIVKNNLSQNTFGLQLSNGGSYYVSGNNIEGGIVDGSGDNFAGCGIEFNQGCYNTTVYRNNIMRYGRGIDLYNFAFEANTSFIGSGNLVYYNNFFNNSQNVIVERGNVNVIKNPELNNGTDMLSWDNGFAGNYWSDYSGQGNYVIDENNVDNYPLTQQVAITEPVTSLTLLVTVSVVVGVFIAIIIFFLFARERRRKKLI
jgi:parallel beta-helix repeat protein